MSSGGRPVEKVDECGVPVSDRAGATVSSSAGPISATPFVPSSPDSSVSVTTELASDSSPEDSSVAGAIRGAVRARYSLSVKRTSDMIVDQLASPSRSSLTQRPRPRSHSCSPP